MRPRPRAATQRVDLGEGYGIQVRRISPTSPVAHPVGLHRRHLDSGAVMDGQAQPPERQQVRERPQRGLALTGLPARHQSLGDPQRPGKFALAQVAAPPHPPDEPRYIQVGALGTPDFSFHHLRTVSPATDRMRRPASSTARESSRQASGELLRPPNSPAAPGRRTGPPNPTTTTATATATATTTQAHSFSARRLRREC